MWLSKLELLNFRNYLSLNLELSPRPIVLVGENAQGKSNLLEAISMLATMRPQRAASERELINWEAAKGEMPLARIAGDVSREGDRVRVEIVLQARENLQTPWQAAAISEMYQGAPFSHESRPYIFHVQKQVRINGVSRSAAGAVGQAMAVIFDSSDIELVGGPPALRRRCLDVICSQIDRPYLRCLQRYSRVLFQRNHLLRLLQERSGDPAQLDFWDKELARCGTYIMSLRRGIIGALETAAAAVYEGLGLAEGELKFFYLPSLKIERRLLEDPAKAAEVGQLFLEALERARGRDIAHGSTSTGPHRDDLRFVAGEIDMGTYGSRGQRRSIALSLRLGEGEVMKERRREYPILLMDDALSELDEMRRGQFLKTISKYSQVILTTTDTRSLETWFLDRSVVLQVRGGTIKGT